MNRFILNLLAGATILAGGWALLSPKATSSDPDEACCTVTIKYGDSEIKRQCCGGSCETTPDNRCKS